MEEGCRGSNYARTGLNGAAWGKLQYLLSPEKGGKFQGIGPGSGVEKQFISRETIFWGGGGEGGFLRSQVTAKRGARSREEAKGETSTSGVVGGEEFFGLMRKVECK